MNLTIDELERLLYVSGDDARAVLLQVEEQLAPDELDFRDLEAQVERLEEDLGDAERKTDALAWCLDAVADALDGASPSLLMLSELLHQLCAAPPESDRERGAVKKKIEDALS